MKKWLERRRDAAELRRMEQKQEEIERRVTRVEAEVRALQVRRQRGIPA